MPTQMHVHTFAMNLATGTQAVTITGLAFTPTVALCFGTRSTMNTAGTNSAQMFFGAAVDSGDYRSVGGASRQGATTGQTVYYMMVERLGEISDTANVIDSYFQFVSMTSTTVTINIVEAPAAAWDVTLVLLGGDVTGAETFFHNLGTGTGDKTKILTNGGTPSCVLFFLAGTLVSFDVQAHISGNMTQTLGWMCPDGTQGYAMSRHQNGVPISDTVVRLRSDCCMGLFTPTAENFEASFVSIGAGQYVVNVPRTPVASHRVFGVALYGGHFTSVGWNANTTTGQQEVMTPGVDPVGILLQTVGKITNSGTGTAGSDPGGSRGLGAADDGVGGTVRQSTIAYQDPDGLETPSALSYAHRDECLADYQAGSVVNTWTYVSGGAERFTLDHTTANGVAVRMLALAVGDTPAAAGGGAGPLVNAPPLKSMLRGLVNV